MTTFGPALSAPVLESIAPLAFLAALEALFSPSGFSIASALAGALEVLSAFALAIPFRFDPEPAHLVGTGGAIGAILRHWVYVRLESDGFPLATLTVNVVGSFALGIAVFAGWDEFALQFLGVGICGAFTTFSSFSVETVQLWERGDRRLAVLTAAGNLLVSLAAIGLAWVLVSVAF